MTITYRYLSQRVKIPVLHRVVYGQTERGVPAQFQRSIKDHEIDEWLKANCRHNYHYSPGYFKEKFIEFEDDHEAAMFALRWT